MRIFTIILLLLAISATTAPVDAQQAASGTDVTAGRAATGGAQTREEIMARQRGEQVPTRERGTVDGHAADLAAQLGVLGGTSDSEIWEKLRYGRADVSVSAGGPEAAVLVQDTGMAWYNFRAGPLRDWTVYLLGGMLGVLFIFYLVRGKIRIEHGRSGQTIQRFNLLERTAHWTLAVSFIVLGLTGLITLFGRVALIPLFGKESFAVLASGSKWLHNWIAWPFIAALVLVFLLWVVHNIPNRHDIKWMLKGGGLFTKGSHPPARKFNAGQKIIFWVVIILGGSVAASGLSLLMPFELPLFSKSFEIANSLGIPAIYGGDPLPAELTPHAEMQLASVWHAIVAIVMIAIILAHIYLGSVGMEGAFDAMGSGEVDLQWAKEHHSLWVEEVQNRAEQNAAATPAE